MDSLYYKDYLHTPKKIICIDNLNKIQKFREICNKLHQ